ncbi:hypothetical protein PRUPE_1G437000 [Prunus persica]|uniref:EF-hand domain-containing protein n=1 Tax=Prunus persica TaxID=3760 RepID=M5XHL4_PRUPE|nr:hypothetical protein PRUPE_1G436800 [Prunus persica]ONI33631.1 hypothetical protein PRUPE_1G437000 [Prunus persica]
MGYHNNLDKVRNKRAKFPYTKEQIRNVFKRHDKNGDGQLSKDELDAAFKELGSIWPPGRAWFAQRYADDDGDGFISIDKELSKLVQYALELKYTLK